jgi:muramoyltetrapeptide carboxypeptidase
MRKIPPYLKPGDTIGLCAPAGFMAFEKMSTCIDVLQQWGYTVKLGATTHSTSENYFSGTDEDRLRDLQDLLDDPEVKGILCVRGGYGTSRIVDDLSFRKFRKHPKWIIGFSDITVLHNHIYRRYGIPAFHAPMAAAFNTEQGQDPFVGSLKAAMEGKLSDYIAEPNHFNIPGTGSGELVGGNLSLLIHGIGTPSELKTRNRILFLEDTGEYLYSIDRMFLQLKRAGKLRHLTGLIIGGFDEMKDTERPFGKTIYELIRDHVIDAPYPVCFGFPVSHAKENYCLKHGAMHTLTVTEMSVRLQERF